MDSVVTASRANWLVSNDATTTCSYRWEGNDNQVIFSSVPRITRSKSLVASSWTAPAIPLPESSQVTGFQVNVYATASTPSCTIDLIRFGVNEINATDFQWRQFMVTDSSNEIRRYVYRNMTTRLTPDYRLSGESLITPPGHLSIIMTHSNNQNGSCWVDCIELQLLYTQTGKLTLPPGETTTAVGASNNNNNGTLAVVTGSTAVAAPISNNGPSVAVPIDFVIGGAAGAGLLIALLIVAIVCLMRQKKERQLAASKRKSVAMQVELDSGQAAAGGRQNIYGLPPDMKTPLPKHVPATPAAGREPVYQQAGEIRPIDAGGAYQSIALGSSGEGPAQAYQSLAPEATEQAYQALPPETADPQQEYRSLPPEKDPLMYVNLAPENDVSPVVYETFEH
jgi:hypothetical protein